MQQNEAFDLLKMGRNIFLTGAAGAGKTHLLNRYIGYLKENNVTVAVTASTGIAATHIQGTTIHSWSGIGVSESLSEKELEKIAASPRIKRNYKNTKVLIIDEISMLHKHQLDLVDSIARHVLGNNKPFGGMQIILCGDFFQLPPVSANSSAEKYFAFEAGSWERGDFHICYLHEQHRQGDDELLTILNDIRGGTAGEHTKVPLRTRYKKEPEGATRATKLYSRNINVDAINDNELSNIRDKERTFIMETTGFGALVDGLKKTCLAVEKLKLKIGAEVMFIKNDNTGAYANGTRGIVTGFDKEEGWPLVKTYDNRNLIAYPEEWKYEDNGTIRATLTQIPLRLAWAITIHKSQGMTLDAAEIDLSDAFEPGMGYVALSRVRRLSGLKLMGLNQMALTVERKILEYDKILKEKSAESVRYLNSLSLHEKAEQQYKTLAGRFEGSAVKPENKTRHKKDADKKEKRISTHITTLQMLKENMPVNIIAEQRNISTGTILNHIEKLKGEKRLDIAQLSHLKSSIPFNDFNNILDELKNSPDGKIKTVYDKFNGRYSYDNIKIVRLFAG